jgi:predicted nuclease of restriction endonuclease-like (RecB) superfamily
MSMELNNLSSVKSSNLCKSVIQTVNWSLGNQNASELQQLVGEIPWGHNILIMQRIKSGSARRYYLEAVALLG